MMMLRYLMVLLLCCSWLQATEESVSLSQEPQAQLIPLAYQVVLSPYQKTSFSSDINTQIVSINKRLGETFEAGEVLIQLDDVVHRNLYLKALATLQKAEVIYEAKHALYQDNIASFQDFIDAQSALAIAQAEVGIARKNLANTQIIAPYDGRVTHVNVEIAEYPNHQYNYNDKPMMEIIHDRTLLAKVLIPAAFLPKIYKGQPLIIEIKETGQKIRAPIYRIGAAIDPSSSTVLIEAKVDNQNRELMSGMTGKGYIEMDPPYEFNITQTRTEDTL